MRKRVQIAVTVFLVLIAGIVGLRMFHSPTREPVYQGKALTVWLCEYLGWDTTPRDWAQAKNKAEVAVRQIGTNAIPTLLDLVRETNSAAMSELCDEWERRIEGIRYLPIWVRHPAWYKSRARYRNAEGEVGFKILGADAREAVPELMSIYQKTFTMDSFAAMDSQLAVSRALIDIGPATIPSLMRWAVSSNESEQVGAVYVLSQINAQPSVVIPVLVASLSHTNVQIRISAVEGLGKFGAEAQRAVPELVQALHDTNGQVRRAASNSLKAIDPEAAAKAGGL